MAQYPIKLLKDETGTPFVPLTSLNAVTGEEYILSTFLVEKVLNGHYKITNDKLQEKNILNRIITVKFPKIEDTTAISYLRLNEEAEYPIYDAEGQNGVLLTDLSNTTTFLTLTDGMYRMIKVSATGASSGGGHVIVTESGDLLPQRPTLTFKGINASDDSSMGTTVISAPSLVNNLTTTESGLGGLDAYQGKVLLDKIPSVNNTLTSTSATEALSAYQGQVLNEKIGTKLDKIDVVDNSISSYTSKALSANQGRIINGSGGWCDSVWVDLTGGSFNEDKWYPVVGEAIPRKGLIGYKISVQLDSGSHPSWASHGSGFSVDFEIKVQASGWGTTGGSAIVVFDDYSHCNVSPVSFTQLGYGSRPVFYCRGGGKYHIYAQTYHPDWQAYSQDYVWTSGEYRQTAPVYDSRPAPPSTSLLYPDQAKSSKRSLGVADYNNTSSTIQIGYSGAGVTNPDFFACYTSVGDYYGIKDISVGAARDRLTVPTIFVQSSQPTANRTGDIWFS